MLSLLKLEWLKLKKNRIFHVLFMAYFIFLPSAIILMKRLNISPPMMKENTFFTFPQIWSTMGYVGNWLVFMMCGFVMVYWLTTEYRNKTFRQNIINGLGRNNYFLSKLYLLLFISVIATAYYLICGLILGSIYGGELNTSLFELMSDVGIRYFVMSVGYLSIAMLIGFLIKHSGLAIITYISYGLIIENIIRYLVHMRIVKNVTVHYYPVNAMEDLMPIPFSEVADNFIKESGFSMFLDPSTAMTLSLFYIALFLGLSWLRCKKVAI